MAIKFFKVLGGLSKLFNKTNKKADFSNLATAASNKGINENSIVHVTATDSDTTDFGARYLPDTSILYVNGLPHIDSKNILFGISMLVYNNIPVFIAPKGLLKATDKVKYGRILKTNAGGTVAHGGNSIGLTIPNLSDGISLILYEGSTNSSMEKWAFAKDASTTSTTGLADYLNAEKNDDITGTKLANSKIAFSIWRNNVLISDWFLWYFDGNRLRVEKGLYLPGVLDITYQKLVEKVSNKKLVPGRKYRITDYQPSSIKTDLVYSGATNSGLYLTALTKNTLSEDGILVYEDLLCEVKYGLKKNRWSGKWKLSIPTSVTQITGTITDYPTTWSVLATNEISDQIKEALGNFSTTSCNYWFKCTYQSKVYYATDKLNANYSDMIDITAVREDDVQNDISGLLRFSENIVAFSNDATGEVYWMRDPKGNEATYDFKGYMLKDSSDDTHFTFDSGDVANKGSDGDASLSTGKAYGNKLLFEGYDANTYIGNGLSNVILTQKWSCGDITESLRGTTVVANNFATPSGTFSQFLMANGSILDGIKADALSLDAGDTPTVSFSDGTFHFGIPEGLEGEPGKDGTITGTSTTIGGDVVKDITMNGSTLEVTKLDLTDTLNNYVKKSGDTMSGNLSILTLTSPTLTLGSSTITYNKTTGCLEITA